MLIRIELNIVCAAILLIIFLNSKQNQETKKNLNYLRLSLLAIGFVCLVDAIRVGLLGRNGESITIALKIIYAIYYISACFSAVSLFMYACNYFDINIKIRYKILTTIPFALVIIHAIISIFTNNYFCINENNEFEKGSSYWVMYLCIGIYMLGYGILAIVEFFKSSLSIEKRDSVLFLFLAVVPIVLGTIQAFHVERNLIWPATMIMMTILYVSNNIKDRSYDYLTKVFNRGTFQTFVIKKLNHNKSEMPFLIVDIDNFKQVNDKYGHRQGDLVLQKIGYSLKKTYGNNSIVGRIGGDEFAVLVTSKISEEQLINKSKIFLKSVNDILAGISTVKFSCSIGICFTKKEHCDYLEIYQKADQALYLSKERGRNRLTLYSTDDIVENAIRPIMMIVDDCEINRIILSSYFEENFNIIEAANGKEALEYITLYGDSIHCILLDLVMPVMNGEEFLKSISINKLYPSNKIVLITVLDLETDELTKMGVAGFIKKPFDPSDAAKLIKDLFKKNS